MKVVSCDFEIDEYDHSKCPFFKVVSKPVSFLVSSEWVLAIQTALRCRSGCNVPLQCSEAMSESEAWSLNWIFAQSGRGVAYA